MKWNEILGQGYELGNFEFQLSLFFGMNIYINFKKNSKNLNIRGYLNKKRIINKRSFI